MRHRIKKSTLNKPADHRKAMVRNLLTSLFLEQKVVTTDAKAKALSSEAEKLVTKIKTQETMNAIRSLKQVLFTDESSKKALEYAGKTDKTSGFTRLTKIGMRAGDNALMIQVELITNN